MGISSSNFFFCVWNRCMYFTCKANSSSHILLTTSMCVSNHLHYNTYLNRCQVLLFSRVVITCRSILSPKKCRISFKFVQNHLQSELCPCHRIYQYLFHRLQLLVSQGKNFGIVLQFVFFLFLSVSYSTYILRSPIVALRPTTLKFTIPGLFSICNPVRKNSLTLHSARNHFSASS